MVIGSYLLTCSFSWSCPVFHLAIVKKYSLLWNALSFFLSCREVRRSLHTGDGRQEFVFIFWVCSNKIGGWSQDHQCEMEPVGEGSFLVFPSFLRPGHTFLPRGLLLYHYMVQGRHTAFICLSTCLLLLEECILITSSQFAYIYKDLISK